MQRGAAGRTPRGTRAGHQTSLEPVSNITARISHETLHTITRLYSANAGAPLGTDGAALLRSWRAAGQPCAICPTHPGYVQSINLDDLAAALMRPQLRLHIAVCPGDFVVPETAIAEAWPPEDADETLVRVIRGHVLVVPQRDFHQDAAFGVRQLADIALKALSPGINDPTTAINAIGYLHAVLARLARQELPSPVRRTPTGAQGEATVVSRQRTFEEYMDVFLEIGRYASGDARVACSLLDALAGITAAARECADMPRLAMLCSVADSVAVPALAAAKTDHDRLLVTTRREHVARAAV